MDFARSFEGIAITQAKRDVREAERDVGNRGGGGTADGPSTTFRTSFKTAIANRKSAMLLLSQVFTYDMMGNLGYLAKQHSKRLR